MKAFITGGTGFIGSFFAEFLLDRGDEVFALVRDPKKPKWLKGLGVHILEGNLFSIPSLPSDLDYVFHLAGMTKTTKIADYYTVNQNGTASLFRSLSRQKLRPKVICMSSMAACGPARNGRPVREDDPPRPVSPYGKSKHLGELEALKFKDRLHVTILRPAGVFGPRDRDFLEYFKMVNRGFLIVSGGKHLRVSLCYVKDLVRALSLCTRADLRSGEVFHIGAPDPPTWHELGQAAAQLMGRRARTVRIPRPAAFTYALLTEILGRMTGNVGAFTLNKYLEMKQGSWILDVRKAEETLSFSADTDLQKGLTETLEWYREAGWLKGAASS